MAAAAVVVVVAAAAVAVVVVVVVLEAVVVAAVFVVLSGFSVGSRVGLVGGLFLVARPPFNRPRVILTCIATVLLQRTPTV